MRYFALILLIPMALFSQGRGRGGAAISPASGGQPAVMPPPPPPTPTADLATIQGQVVNALSGTPLTKAHIIINRVNRGGPMPMGSRNSYSATTDASGNFTVTGIEPGTYRLNADRTGFLSGQYNARRPGASGTPLDLGRAQRMSNVVLKLTPHGVISGKITDEDGDPLEGVQVQAMRYVYNQGKKQLQQNGGGSTNDLGQYRISGIMPGKYFLAATYRGGRGMMMDMVNLQNGAPPSDAPQEDYVTTFYAGATDPSAAAPIDLNPGDQVEGIDLRMARTHTVHIRGRVIDNVDPAPPPPAGGRGVDGVTGNFLNGQVVVNQGPNMRVQIRLQPRNSLASLGIMMANSAVKADGTFDFMSVPPGQYYLVAMSNQANSRHGVAQPIDVGNNSLEGITIAINPGIAVIGHVHYDGDPPDPLPSLRVNLVPQDRTVGVPPPQPVKVEADGSFRFEDVNPDHYDVNINVPPGLYLKSVRAGNTDAMVSGLDLSNGAGALDILLGTNPPQVSGSVVDPNTQQPAPSATVVLIPQEKERQNASTFYITTNTDQYGNFTFSRVTPGQYRVYAWEDVQYGQWFDPDFMKKYDTKGEPAAAQEGTPVNLKLTLIPAQ